MSSGDEMMDDGLHIKPPQHHRHKDRKRSHRHHSSRRKEEIGVSAAGIGGGGDDRRRNRNREEDERGSTRARGVVHSTIERIERKDKERFDKRAAGHRRQDGHSRDILLEVKKERRHIELENERVLRDIERRREKERGVGEDSGHNEMKERSRDKKRHAVPSTPPPEVEAMEEERIHIHRKRLAGGRLNFEVEEIEDSGSDLEEGEQVSSSAHSKEEKEHGDASDKSDVSSASENEQEQPEKARISDAGSDASSGKSGSDGNDSSSSSSSSDSESEQENAENGNDDDASKPPKIRKESPTTHPLEGDPEKKDSENKTEEDNNGKNIPTVSIDEVEEEDLLPPYFPALQGCRRVEEFQLLNRIEEGTYGVVYRAKEKRTDEVVALKRLKMEKEKDGFPITSLREINTLLKAQHENIVTVREIVVGSNTDKIFLVMDYVEHDLKALMETLKAKGQVFLIEEVKCLMIQLLRAVAHMHDNWILHRDLKTSNLLLSHKGILKVGDFGLAREYGSPLKPYTAVVVTLWYRSPELLLGAKEYSTPIDVWSVGCIFGELLKMEPMFPGKSEANQLNLIFQSLGTPNDRIWPGYTKLPMLQKMSFADYPVNKLKTRFGHLTDQGIDLMNKFLTFNPAKRITAEDALEHAFFKEMPAPIDPSMFPTWPAKSELGHRKAAASPKPPSGRKLKEDEDTSRFFLGGGDARRQPVGAGFSLKF